MDYSTLEITRAIAIAAPVGLMMGLMLGYTLSGGGSSHRSREGR
ncbi:MAG TPA: hypothetical protein VJ793_23595 [Anaerolineae bacterium]|nr:hypothetical protein [Anaerolineae bacterium]